MKTASISTQHLSWPLFHENTPALFSINHRQSVITQPTHPPCLCMALWLLFPNPAQHGWPRLSCKEIDQLLSQCLSLCDQTHSSGLTSLELAWCHLVASNLGSLPQHPSLQRPLPPLLGFQALYRHDCLLLLVVRWKTFVLFLTAFHKFRYIFKIT